MAHSHNGDPLGREEEHEEEQAENLRHLGLAAPLYERLRRLHFGQENLEWLGTVTDMFRRSAERCDMLSVFRDATGLEKAVEVLREEAQERAGPDGGEPEPEHSLAAYREEPGYSLAAYQSTVEEEIIAILTANCQCRVPRQRTDLLDDLPE